MIQVAQVWRKDIDDCKTWKFIEGLNDKSIDIIYFTFQCGEYTVEHAHAATCIKF